MSNATPAALVQALALTYEMLEAAQAQDWESLTRLDALREPLMQPQGPLQHADREALQELLDCNQHIATCVAQAREQAAADWQAAHSGHRAAMDYQRIARDGEA